MITFLATFYFRLIKFYIQDQARLFVDTPARHLRNPEMLVLLCRTSDDMSWDWLTEVGRNGC